MAFVLPSTKRRVEINVEISVKEFERNEAQEELVEMMRKRKTYEKLKEKQYFAYKKEVELEESKILDDFISSNGGELKKNYVSFQDLQQNLLHLQYFLLPSHKLLKG